LPLCITGRSLVSIGNERPAEFGNYCLNKISNEYIRKNSNKVYRREEDFKEIAVALGLYDEYIDGIII